MQITNMLTLPENNQAPLSRWTPLCDGRGIKRGDTESYNCEGYGLWQERIWSWNDYDIFALLDGVTSEDGRNKRFELIDWQDLRANDLVVYCNEYHNIQHYARVVNPHPLDPKQSSVLSKWGQLELIECELHECSAYAKYAVAMREV